MNDEIYPLDSGEANVPVPWAPPTARRLRGLPTFCRVTADITPAADFYIKIEVSLPVNGWNAKFQAVGNGGRASAISDKTLDSTPSDPIHASRSLWQR